MSKVPTKNITFWNTSGYNYPGFGKSTEVPDGLGGTVGITYNQMDYNDRTWRAKPDGNVPVTEDRFLSGEIENNFSLIGEVKAITATMPLIRALGSENNYSVTLDFSKYKASAGGSKASDGATSGDTYLAISRFFNGSKAGYTTIKVTAITLDGSELNLGDWKLFNSGTLGQGNNARIFLDAATQIISGKNSLGKQEFCPTPPNPGSSFGTDTGLGLFELPSNQRYVSITLNFKQKKITGPSPNDLHNIYVASNTSSTSPIDETPPPPMDINRGLQLHLPLNEIVENAESEKEVVDISGAQLNGKVNGATVVADSKFGHCINFDGVDDYIELPTATIPQTGAITISFWANGDSSLPKDNSIIAAYDQSSNNRVVNIHLPWNDSKIYFDCGNTGNSYDRIEKLAEAVDFKDKWTHWVLTKNVTTGEMNIYLNGTLWHSGHGQNKPIGAVSLVKFGSGYAFYHGQVAHLRIYERVLSPEEINECMKVDVTPPPSMAGEDDTTPTTDGTETTSTNGEDGTTPTTDGTETTSTTGDNDTTPTTDDIETTPTTNEGNTDPTSTAGEDDVDSTTDGTETTPTTGEGNTDATSTTDGTDTTSTPDGTNPTPTPDGTDTTQKPMEYKIYQVKGNPTIKTGYPASEWTAILAGFNCGAKQKHKATALTIMPVVDDGEWKIKCDIKDADDRYWDVAVLFIRNNMVNRLSNFYR